jgi:hypothetical protein
MGYDKLIHFLSKNLSNKVFEEILPNENPTNLTQHICIDINFIIYNCIYDIENDINEMLKLINAIQFTDMNIVKEKILLIINKKYWKKNINFTTILCGDTITIIRKNLFDVINNKINIILYNHILLEIVNNIKNIYNHNFIKSINVFFDGIPSYAKIIEQRKRRINNYIESQKRKKLYKKHFDNIKSYILEDDNIVYDYIYWADNMFSFDKAIGPQSILLSGLKQYIIKYIRLYFDKVTIYIDDGSNYGEADYKIIKYIQNLNGNITIFSCDTDFIFYILLFQLKNDNGNIYNFLKINNNTYNLYNGSNILDLLKNKYEKVNNINDINILVMNDLLFVIMLFGNDFIPYNYEINTDISINIIFRILYQLHKSNKYIINLNSKNKLNYNNYKFLLQQLLKSNSFSIIYINKNYKVPYIFTSIILEKLKYNINDMIKNIIKPYLIYSYNKDCDEDDIRTILYNNNQNKLNSNKLNPNGLNPIDKLKLSNDDRNKLKIAMSNMFDYSNINDYGLIKLERKNDICNNQLNNLYNHICNNSKVTNCFYTNIDKAYDEYINITNKSNIEEYLNLLNYYVDIYFNDINIHNYRNIIHYKYKYPPNFTNIIKYIENNYIKKPVYELLPIYFDELSHQLFITPYLLNSKYLSQLNKIKYIDKILQIIQYNIKNIWDYQLNLTENDVKEYLYLYNKLIVLFNSNIVDKLYNYNIAING